MSYKHGRFQKSSFKCTVQSIMCYDVSVTVPSVEQAAIAAGQPESVSKIGNCALFSDTTTVNVDNEQVACEIVFKLAHSDHQHDN